jgi:hypothetical protein
MKYIINERQYKLLTEQEEEILSIPFAVFDYNWEVLQKFLEKGGNPPYEIMDDLDLEDSRIQSLGNLTSVGGGLYLSYSKIESLGNLTSVGGNLDLNGVNIQSLGNLTSVGGWLDLEGTPLSKKYTEEEIREMVKVGGNVYL